MSNRQRGATVASVDTGGPAVVRAERVTRCYRSGAAAVMAVRGVSALVAPQARIALTGPSGSGKTTLLHLLAGLDTPTAGVISWPDAGEHPDAESERVGLVFQGPSLIPSLNVIENVRLPLLFAGHLETEATTCAQGALHRLGLDALAAAVPDELSGGQAQRVAIARVLAAAPRLILADEPTARMNHSSAARVTDVLIGAADESDAALIVSTHDPMIARRLPTVWTMRDGRLHISTDASRRSR